MKSIYDEDNQVRMKEKLGKSKNSMIVLGKRRGELISTEQ